MKTEEALDLAYENPFVCITTENLYEIGEKFFYYDKAGNLKDYTGSIITEDKLYNIVKGSENEEFDEWIEVEGEIPEDNNIDESYDDYDSYDD